MTTPDSQSISDQMPENFSAHRRELENSDERLRYLVERRDQFSEKLLLGSLALNGASLVALLSVLGGGGNAAAALGFTHEISLYSAVCFSAGLVLAGFAANQRENAYTTEAGDAVRRAEAYAMLVNIADSEFNRDNMDRYAEFMEKAHQAPLVGFQASKLSILARHLSGGAWLTGILLPMSSTLHLSMPQWWPL